VKSSFCAGDDAPALAQRIRDTRGGNRLMMAGLHRFDNSESEAGDAPAVRFLVRCDNWLRQIGGLAG
jgi:hypothetical protein